uniref:Uncharacterized protein n=1 Tax=Grammatophora oceanica TaxID=210454 RepID=A0A7S1V779_9STRA|mmetsp:Transcript_38559/g.57314  ORF Transcript_38559/g.57314 Transcript_38559/m.57314 type:complete len:317 (+) Transcript_38559:177-1127(+)
MAKTTSSPHLDKVPLIRKDSTRGALAPRPQEGQPNRSRSNTDESTRGAFGKPIQRQNNQQPPYQHRTTGNRKSGGRQGAPPRIPSRDQLNKVAQQVSAGRSPTISQSKTVKMQSMVSPKGDQVPPTKRSQPHPLSVRTQTLPEHSPPQQVPRSDMYMSSSIDMLVSSDSLPADSTDRPYPKNESSSASSQSLGYSSKTFHFDPAQFGALSRGEVNIGVRPQPPPISSVDSLGYSARSKFASESPSIRTGTFAPIRSGDVLDGKSMRTGIFEPIPSGDVFDGESDVVSDDVAPPPDGLEEHPSSLEMFETTENESQN